MTEQPIPLDPIEPTALGTNLTSIPLSPTVWDDLPDGQCAVSPDGVVWQRRDGLWWMHPWWQRSEAEEIKAICDSPDEWAYNNGWPRHLVEAGVGELTPITLPGTTS